MPQDGDYNNWTLALLKQELRRRKVKVSGRKKELIERLLFYDRHNIKAAETLQPEFHMKLPESSVYKDVHSGMKDTFPSFTRQRVLSYLQQYGKSLDKKCKEMYEQRYMRCLRLAILDSQSFVSAIVWAEMRKSVAYKVDVCIDSRGVVVEAQCECGAGQGPSAHCKHVACVLYAAEQFATSGSTPVCEVTCTQVLQTFHHAKPHQGSPMKTCDLQIVRKSDSQLVYDPRPPAYRNREGYMDNFRNACINFEQGAQMPVRQLFSPANIPAMAHDHWYQAETMEEDFLRKYRVSEITEQERVQIEEQTRRQSTSRRWFEERTKRLTSSHFGEICKATERRDKTKLAESYTVVRDLRCPAIQHGRKYEAVAVEEYQLETQRKTSACGMFVSPDYPFIAASPDRVVDDSTLLEVKCPFTAREQLISHASVPYLKLNEDGDLELDRNHQYYYQVQGQMFCTGKQHCDFVVYTFKDMKVLNINFDQCFVDKMVEQLKSFYVDYFRDVVVKVHFYKDYYKYQAM